MTTFCEYCGKQLDGVACGCPASLGASAAQPIPHSPAAQPPDRAAVPEGFALDAGSGLYYKMTLGNDNAGRPGKWVTWFYPDTGKYVQDFTPDAPAAASAPAQAPAPQYPQQQAQAASSPASQHPPQSASQAPAYAQQYPPQQAPPPSAPQYPPTSGYAPPPSQQMNPAAAKKLSPVHIIIPLAGLIIGVVLAFIQYR